MRMVHHPKLRLAVTLRTQSKSLSLALKRAFVVAFIVQAKAWTYLRNNDKDIG